MHVHAHSCPFSGGGDIHIIKKGTLTSAAVIQQMASEDNSAREQPDPIPPTISVDTSPHAATPCISTSQGSTHQSTTAPSGSDITPPKEGELRCGTTEHKLLSHVQSDEEVSMQLQASMMLASSVLLRRGIIENPTAAASINVITCYGLQIGPTYPLKIFQMIMDFAESSCRYEEQFCLYPCGVYPAYIDIALNYIIQRL